MENLTLNDQNEIANIQVENYIYILRGEQVMLDSDIAYFFGTTTKNINRQMKRNIERFPNDFCFQINKTELENLRCQNGATKISFKRRYYPYAYTEHGIIALAGILKNDIASKMSVEIVRKFVQMRKFIYENGDILLSIAKLQNRQLEFENETNIKFDKLFNITAEFDFPKKALFYAGQLYDAFDFITNIINKANNSIILIDPYCDKKALTFLSHKKDNVSILVIKNSKSKLSNEEIEIFKSQYGNITAKVFDDIHDRYLIIDNEECYSLGTSLNNAGKKLFTINKIEDIDITQVIIKKINNCSEENS